MTLAFWRWGDGWCQENRDWCLETWMRLMGVCVGTSLHGGDVELCGCVGGYNLDQQLMFYEQTDTRMYNKM